MVIEYLGADRKTHTIFANAIEALQLLEEHSLYNIEIIEIAIQNKILNITRLMQVLKF